MRTTKSLFKSVKMSYVSIDSSLANTGIAVGFVDEDLNVVVERIELHTTEKSKNKKIRASSDTIYRCKTTYEFIQSVLSEVKPQVVFAETPSGSQNASGMKSYGAVCQLLGTINPPPIEVTPTEVKKAIKGKKTVSKREIIDWAYGKYPDLDWLWHGGKLQNKNEHLADAIGIVYAGIKTNEFQRLLNLHS